MIPVEAWGQVNRMTEIPDILDLYDRLIVINEEQFNARLFNAAYHALASAMHCANQLDQDDLLINISQIANKQIAWIDENYPDYEHSTRSAARRKLPSIYKALAIQAETRLAMRQENRRRQNQR